jgi:hypothetical protein
MSTDSNVMCAAYDMIRIVIAPAPYEVIVANAALGRTAEARATFWVAQ